MKKLFFLLIFLFIQGCNKPKTVFVCGDHICVNKQEAKQYFEDNLSLEVKIINNKKDNNIDLVELNLNSSSKTKKKISIFKKKSTDKKIKVLSKEEIVLKKAQIKVRNEENLKKKKKKNKKSLIVKQPKKEINLKVKSNNELLHDKTTVNKTKGELDDICVILKDCSIDEISKFLIKKGKKEDFPDITTRK